MCLSRVEEQIDQPLARVLIALAGFFTTLTVTFGISDTRMIVQHSYIVSWLPAKVSTKNVARVLNEVIYRVMIYFAFASQKQSS